MVPAEDDNGLIKPKAYVVLKDFGGEDDAGRALYEELKVHVKRTIGPWKYPRWIEFVDSLPKTATGKVQRYMLRDKAINATGADSMRPPLSHYCLAVLRRRRIATFALDARRLGRPRSSYRMSTTPTSTRPAASWCARSATPAG